MRDFTLFPVAIALPVSTAGLSSQSDSTIEVGTGVRVTAATLGMRNHTGAVTAFISDTLVVDTFLIPIHALTKLEPHRGMKSNAGKGTLIGTAIWSDKWEESQFEYIQIGLAPKLDGAAAGLRLSF